MIIIRGVIKVVPFSFYTIPPHVLKYYGSTEKICFRCLSCQLAKFHTRTVFRNISHNTQDLSLVNFQTSLIRNFHLNTVLLSQSAEDDLKKDDLIAFKEFEQGGNKSKDTFLDAVKMYNEKIVHKRNVCDFIKAALKLMPEYGVEEDLETYKILIDLMPKGKFIPSSMIQAEFMHYPREQYTMIDLLEQMSNYGVCPDDEMGIMLLSIFGKRAYPLRKYWRMKYWLPKFKNASPWPVPKNVPLDALALAKMAVERMTSVDLLSEVKVYKAENVKDSIDKTWIVSGQSPMQKKLLKNHSVSEPIAVCGPDLIWLRKRKLNYFTLKSEKEEVEDIPPPDPSEVGNFQVPFYNMDYVPAKEKSVHEQDDGNVYAICITGTSSHDSLLSWIRLLQVDGNPKLEEIPVLFKLKSATVDPDVEDQQELSGDEQAQLDSTIADIILKGKSSGEQQEEVQTKVEATTTDPKVVEKKTLDEEQKKTQTKVEPTTSDANDIKVKSRQKKSPFDEQKKVQSEVKSATAEPKVRQKKTSDDDPKKVRTKVESTKTDQKVKVRTKKTKENDPKKS